MPILALPGSKAGKQGAGPGSGAPCLLLCWLWVEFGTLTIGNALPYHRQQGQDLP